VSAHSRRNEARPEQDWSLEKVMVVLNFDEKLKGRVGE
jgi:hypothetical protein